MLILDTDAAYARGLSRLLRPQFAEIAHAQRPEDAWSILTAQPERFDLVLVDLQMPESGGAAFAASVAAQFPRIRVVGMTAGPSVPWRDRVLHKPFTAAELIERLSEG